MALGYAFGALLSRPRPAAARQRLLLSIGMALTAAFVVIRALNGYGEPKPWVVRDNMLGTIVSFLDATKYPPSLVYLLMTLGPSIALLAWMERWKGVAVSFLATFGRVPFFFYVVHIYVIHTRDGRRRLAAGLSGIGDARLLPVPAEGIRLLAAGDLSAVGGARAGDVSDMPMVRLGEGESSASAAVVFVG